MNITTEVNWTSSDDSNIPFYLHVWLMQMSLINGIISILGFIFNTLILIIMPRKAVNVSRIAKIYYLVAVFGDLLIMGKLFSIFILTLVSCYNKTQLYTFITSIEFFWKIMISLYFEGETLSNYAVFILSLERLTSIIFPRWTKKVLNLQAQIMFLITILAPLLIYNAVFGMIFIKVRSSNINQALKTVDIERNDPGNVEFYFLIKLLTFSLPIFGSFFTSCLILIQLSRIRSRRQMDHLNRTRQYQETHRNSRKLLKSCRIAVALNFLNIILYLPTLITWCTIDILTMMSVISDKLIMIGLTFNSLTGIAHIGNFFVYVSLIPSFQRQFQN